MLECIHGYGIPGGGLSQDEQASLSARQRRHTCRPVRNPASPAHPGWRNGRRQRAGLLARGFTFLASPSRIAGIQWSRCEHAADSCGGSPGFSPGSQSSPLRTLVAPGYDQAIRPARQSPDAHNCESTPSCALTLMGEAPIVRPASGAPLVGANRESGEDRASAHIHSGAAPQRYVGTNGDFALSSASSLGSAPSRLASRKVRTAHEPEDLPRPSRHMRDAQAVGLSWEELGVWSACTSARVTTTLLPST
jgi:hypothetical protein